MARHDKAHGTAYVETLAAYLECGCRSQVCADALELHVTTLRYRLARIEELFGIEIDTRERRFSLELAIRLNAMIYDADAQGASVKGLGRGMSEGPAKRVARNAAKSAGKNAGRGTGKGAGKRAG